MKLKIFSSNPIVNVIGTAIGCLIIIVVVGFAHRYIYNQIETTKILRLRDAMQEAYDNGDLDLSQAINCAIAYSEVDKDMESILVPKYLDEMPVFREDELVYQAYQGYLINLYPDSYPQTRTD